LIITAKVFNSLLGYALAYIMDLLPTLHAGLLPSMCALVNSEFVVAQTSWSITDRTLQD